MLELREIHKILMQLEKRAEKKPDEIISSTFVDAEPLLDILSAPLNQIIYGRRGTGKTHALKYCMGQAREAGDVALFLDIRSIGSNGSYFDDEGQDEVERSLRLIMDILLNIQDELYCVAIEKIDSVQDPKQTTIRLDDFSNAIGEVKIVGETARSVRSVAITGNNSGVSANLNVGQDGIALNAGAEVEAADSEEQESVVTQTGTQRRLIDFGRIQTSLRSLIAILGISKLWLFIDEWSETPTELQPFLADLIRKTILPLDATVVKIAAIEHRSFFINHLPKGEYVGLELGADISADLDLDDFLVLDNDQDKSVQFFSDLIFKNFLALDSKSSDVSTASELINKLFTQKTAFEEFVRAVEGVPRDALNLIAKIVTKAFGQQAGIDHVRAAALDWYQQDKVKVVQNNPELNDALNHVIDEVIGVRRARAFLFPAGVRHSMIDRLYDARVLHLLKKNVSSRDEPGKRYDVWKIDYGCYVDLIRTQKAPLGLLPDEEESFVEVPTDDYRSIRRAVLSPENLDKFVGNLQN